MCSQLRELLSRILLLSVLNFICLFFKVEKHQNPIKLTCTCDINLNFVTEAQSRTSANLMLKPFLLIKHNDHNM